MSITQQMNQSKAIRRMRKKGYTEEQLLALFKLADSMGKGLAPVLLASDKQATTTPLKIAS